MKSPKAQAVIFLVIGGIIEMVGMETQKTEPSIGTIVMIVGVVIFAIGVGKIFRKQ